MLMTVLLQYVGEFPDSEETRYLHLFDRKTKREKTRVMLDERYCADPDCDCRRVMLFCYERSLSLLAVIGYGFDDDPSDMPGGCNPYLEPWVDQPEGAEMILAYVTRVIENDAGYRRRLHRHYKEIKRLTRDPSHHSRPAMIEDRRRMSKWAQALITGAAGPPQMVPPRDRHERNRRKRLRRTR